MEFEPNAEILKCSPIPYYHCDINGKITSYNDAAKNVWGREPNLADDLWSGALKEYYYDAGQCYWYNIEKYEKLRNKKEIKTLSVELNPYEVQDINTIKEFLAAKKLFKFNKLK